ncbi:MAG: alpha/beta hydrolase [Cocleimonas sp.]|nr:alpha/beta hydrolase [Cocleimonas sp.]
MKPNNKPQPHVIILHGVLMHALEMFYLVHQLKKAGFIVHPLSYQSILKTPAQNASVLHRKIRQLKANRLHIIAHSLGGIVTTHLLAQFDDLPKGRVVMLGTPIQGSWFAKKLRYYPLINKLLANSMQQGLSGEGIPEWTSKRRWGMIAGQTKRGLAIIAGGLPHNGDGTVMVKETRHQHLSAHITLPISHTGMLFSKQVAHYAAYFLLVGEFPKKENKKEESTAIN